MNTSISFSTKVRWNLPHFKKLKKYDSKTSMSFKYGVQANVMCLRLWEWVSQIAKKKQTPLNCCSKTKYDHHHEHQSHCQQLPVSGAFLARPMRGLWLWFLLGAASYSLPIVWDLFILLTILTSCNKFALFFFETTSLASQANLKCSL